MNPLPKEKVLGALAGSIFAVAVLLSAEVFVPQHALAGLLSAENTGAANARPSPSDPTGGRSPSSPSSGRPGGQYNTGSTNTTRPASNSGSYSSGSLNNYGNSNNTNYSAGNTVLSGGSANTGSRLTNRTGNSVSGSSNRGILNQTISLMSAFNPFITSAYGAETLSGSGSNIPPINWGIGGNVIPNGTQFIEITNPDGTTRLAQLNIISPVVRNSQVTRVNPIFFTPTVTSISGGSPSPYMLTPTANNVAQLPVREQNATFSYTNLDGTTSRVRVGVFERTNPAGSAGVLPGTGGQSTSMPRTTVQGTVDITFSELSGRPVDRDAVEQVMYGVFTTIRTAAGAALPPTGAATREDLTNFLYVVRALSNPNSPAGALAISQADLIAGSSRPQNAATVTAGAAEQIAEVAEALSEVDEDPTNVLVETDEDGTQVALQYEGEAGGTAYIVTRDKNGTTNLTPVPQGTSGSKTFGDAMKSGIYSLVSDFARTTQLQNRGSADNNSTRETNTNTNSYVPAPLCSLEVNPSTISAGQNATLRWSATNLASVKITDSATGAVITSSAAGSKTLSPQTTTVYTGVFTGANNKSSTCVTRVLVLL